MPSLSAPATTRSILGLAIAFCLACPVSGHAESGESAATGNDASLIGDIVVTARRREESVQDVPIAINAYSEEQLRGAGVTSARDIAKLTPGLVWKGDSPFGGNNVFLRGVGSNSVSFTSSPAVAVYLDESYFNSQAFYGFGTFDMERVEVLKGPQGTLYGRNTTGGAIRYSTRKPEIGKGFSGDLNVDAGNFNLIKAEGGLQADLGERSAVRLGFMSWDRDGIYHDYLRDEDTTDVDVKAVRLQFLTEPTDQLSILVSGTYARSRSDDIRFKRVDTVDPATIDFDPVFGPFFTGRCANPGIGTSPGCTSLLQLLGAADDLNTDAYEVQSNLDRREALERVDTWGAGLTLNYDMGFATLTSATSYYGLKYRGPQDVDGTAANIISIYDQARVNQWSQELRLTSNGDAALKWLVGGYFFHEKVKSRQPVNIAPILFGFGSSANQKTDVYSIFAEGTYAVTDRFDITVGARWTHDRRNIDFTHFNYFTDGTAELVSYDEIVAGGFAPGTFQLPDEGKSWSNLSGRIMLSYKIQPDVMLFASFSRGFKAGEFNVGADQPSSATFVGPETLNAYEVGIKSQFLDRRLRFNASAFYYDYKDKQETLFDTGVATLSNADARVKGFELDLTAQPVKGVTLAAGYSYVDAKYKDFPSCRPDGGACDGNRLPAAPKQQLNALLRYEMDVYGRTLAVQGSAQAVSSRFFDFRNVSYIADKSYWLFDARMSYQATDQVEIAGWIQNIGNKRYYSDGFDVSVFGYSLLLPGTPRTYGVSIGYHF